MVERNEAGIIESSKQWVGNVVVGLNFCPFAKPVVDEGRLHYSVVNESDMDVCLTALMAEINRFHADASIETSLLIYPLGFEAFEDYLDLVAVAEELLSVEGFEGIYQLASFHPDYCFDGLQHDDAANYTNRSPYPMLHILREGSIEHALASVASPEKIPSRNVEYARKVGVKALRKLLHEC